MRGYSSPQSQNEHNFPKIVFSDDPITTKVILVGKRVSATLKITATRAEQTEKIGTVSSTQMDLSTNYQEPKEYCVSRVNPYSCTQEERAPSVKPANMTNTHKFNSWPAITS